VVAITGLLIFLSSFMIDDYVQRQNQLKLYRIFLFLLVEQKPISFFNIAPTGQISIAFCAHFIADIGSKFLVHIYFKCITSAFECKNVFYLQYL